MNILYYEHLGGSGIKTTAIYGITQADAIPSVIGEILNTDPVNVVNIEWENNNAIFTIVGDVYVKGGNVGSGGIGENFNRLDSGLCTKVIDLAGTVKELGIAGYESSKWFFNYLSSILVEFNFSEATVINGRESTYLYIFVFHGGTFKRMWLPKLQEMNNYCGFDNSTVLHPDARAYVHPFLKTSNNGERDPNLDNWESHGLKVLYVYTQSSPPTPTTANTLKTPESLYCYLVDFLGNGNEIDEYELYDGNTLLLTNDGKQPISGLLPNTSYNYGIKVRDSGDKWTNLGLIPFTTRATNIPLSKIVGNYDFEEVSGTVIVDTSFKGSNGIRVNASLLQEGKIDYGYKAELTGGYFKIPSLGVKSMAFWTKITSWSLSDPNDSYIFDARTTNAPYMHTTQQAGVSSFKVDNVEVTKLATSIPLNVWSFVYVEFATAMSAGDLFMCTAYILYNRLTTEMNIDLLTTFNDALTSQELTDMYNNGNGSKL